MNPHPRLDRRDWLIIVAISLLALALRIPYLDQGIWHDEIRTLTRFVRTSAIDIWLAPYHPNNHMLYSLFARASIVLFGDSTWALRLPAMVFGAATVPALYYLCRQLDRRDLAILASLFLSTSYFHIWFSQNARGYTGIALGAVLASIFLVKILNRRERSMWLWSAYVLSAVFTASVQLLGALVIISHGLLCLGRYGNPVRNKDWKRLSYVVSLFLVSGLITALIFARAMYLSAVAFDPVTEIADSAEALTVVESGWFPQWLAYRLLEINNALPGGLLTGYILGLVALAGIRITVIKGWIDIGLLLLPIALTATVVYLVSAYWLPRFFFANAGFLVIVGCRGGFEMGRVLMPWLNRRVWFITGCLLALATIIAVPHAWKPKQNTHALQTWLIESSRQDDERACIPMMKPTVDTYLGFDCTVIRNVEDLKKLEIPGRRTVVLATELGHRFYDDHRAVPNYMRTRYQLELELKSTVKGGNTFVFTRDVPESGHSSADLD